VWQRHHIVPRHDRTGSPRSTAQGIDEALQKGGAVRKGTGLKGEAESV
jgi:hypothetical protein